MNVIKCMGGVALCCAIAFLAREPSLGGSIARIDSRSRTLVVTASDGSHHRFRLPAGAAVRGLAAETQPQTETLSQLRPGMDVEVYYSRNASSGTADEVDALLPACPGFAYPGRSAGLRCGPSASP